MSSDTERSWWRAGTLSRSFQGGGPRGRHRRRAGGTAARLACRTRQRERRGRAPAPSRPGAARAPGQQPPWPWPPAARPARPSTSPPAQRSPGTCTHAAACVIAGCLTCNTSLQVCMHASAAHAWRHHIGSNGCGRPHQQGPDHLEPAHDTGKSSPQLLQSICPEGQQEAPGADQRTRRSSARS